MRSKYMSPVVVVMSTCAEERKHFFVGIFSSGIVGTHVGDVTRVVKLLVGTSESSVLVSVDRLAISVVGVSVGVVGDGQQADLLCWSCRWPSRLGEMYEIRFDSTSSFDGVNFSTRFKECWFWRHVGGRCAQSRCRGLVGVKGCRGGMSVGLDGDVGDIVGVVGSANDTSELRSVGRLAAIGMWLLGDVGG